MFQEGVLLKHHSNYKIGGPARYFFEAKSVEEIIKAVEKARRMKTSVFILGAGTNILFSDAGFDGLILKPDIRFIKREGDLIKVSAGVSMTQLLENLMINNLSGLEWAAGLPGTLGGAIRGNAGAFGGEMKTLIKEVTSLDISGSQVKIIKRNNQDCDFDYRSSVFKGQPFDKLRAREIIVEAVLALKKGDRKPMQEIVNRNIHYRKEKQPLEYPNIGSIFKNMPLRQINTDNRRLSADIKKVIKTDPFPVIPAAYLISEAGLKGVSCGGAMISAKHPNFIVNVLTAASNDVKSLIFLAKNEVYKRFKVKLEEEIEYL